MKVKINFKTVITEVILEAKKWPFKNFACLGNYILDSFHSHFFYNNSECIIPCLLYCPYMTLRFLYCPSRGIYTYISFNLFILLYTSIKLWKKSNMLIFMYKLYINALLWMILIQNSTLWVWVCFTHYSAWFQN